MELIDKSAIVAEIKRRKKELIELSNDFANQWACGSLDNILSFINTLEVKKVDLDKEVELWMQGKPSVNFEWGNVADAMRDCAKYFFELGIRA